MLTDFPNPNAVKSVSEYATVFSTLGNPTYLSMYMSDWMSHYGGINDAALALSTIDPTTVAVTEASDQTSLLKLSFNRTVNATGEVINTVYNYQTKTRSDKDVTSGRLLDTEHASADGTSQLTNFAAAGIGGYTLAVNTSVTTFTNGSSIDTTASVTGSAVGFGNVVTIPMNVINFGKIVAISSDGIGLALSAGGSVTNGSPTDTSAAVTGDYGIVFGGANACEVDNFGTVGAAGSFIGIETDGSGPITITNGSVVDTAATIIGDFGISTGLATVSNFGTIVGTGNTAVDLGNSGTVTNGSAADTTAAISGDVGVSIAGSTPDTVTNFGSITGGVRLGAGGGTVINGSTADTGAFITGDNGVLIGGSAGTLDNFGTITGRSTVVSITGAGTIVNAGTIASMEGAAGTAISFQSGTGRLVDDPGSVIVGRISGSGNSTLELASGVSTGGLGGVGTSITGFSTFAVDAGATWTLTGTYGLPDVINDGILAIASGSSLDVSSAVDPSSSGVFQLANQASLEVAAALGSDSKIQFLGAAPTNKLTIDSAANFGTNIGGKSYSGPLLEGFVAGDLIDLKGIASSGLGLNYSAASGELQVTGSGGNALATLLFQNSSLGPGSFHTASDGGRGTIITHS